MQYFFSHKKLNLGFILADKNRRSIISPVRNFLLTEILTRICLGNLSPSIEFAAFDCNVIHTNLLGVITHLYHTNIMTAGVISFQKILLENSLVRVLNYITTHVCDGSHRGYLLSVAYIHFIKNEHCHPYNFILDTMIFILADFAMWLVQR